MAIRIDTLFLVVQDKRLEVQRIVSGDRRKPTIVFLHEGLGSVSMWRDFPEKVVEETGCNAVIYSRHGYGNSEVSCEPRTVRYMHEEALLALPELLDKLAIENPILLGHSDGGSIALIYAGEHHSVRGLILMAPHVFVEDLSVSSIVKAKAAFERTNLAEKLARHHKDAESTFRGWNDIWLSPDFRSWNIEQYLPRITCPVLAVQGLDDQYGTLAQLEAISRQASVLVDRIHLKNCQHSPHREQPDRVLEAISAFVEKLEGSHESS